MRISSALQLAAGAYLLIAGIVTVAAVYLRIIGVYSIIDIVYYYHPELDWQYLLSIILTGPTLVAAFALQKLGASFYITWSWFTALSIVGGLFLIFRYGYGRRSEREAGPIHVSTIWLTMGLYLLLAGWAAIDAMTAAMMIHGRLLDWLYIVLSAPVFGVAYALMYIGLGYPTYITVMCILAVLAIVGGSFLIFWKHPFLLFWNANLPDPYKRIIASAAMYAVLSIVPAFKIDIGFGTPYLHTSASGLANPVVGIILGPIMGAVLAAIGGVIGVMINPVSATVGYGTEYMLLSFIPGTVCAFTSGIIRKGRLRIAASILSALVVVFLAYPPNNVQPIFPYYAWIHLVAIFILISPIGKRAIELARRSKVKDAFTGMALIIFPSTMVEHITESILFTLLMGPSISLFWRKYGMGGMQAFPIERALITFGASIIGVAVLRSSKAKKEEN